LGESRAGKFQGFARAFRLAINEPAGDIYWKALLIMSDLRQKAVENLRLVIHEPAIRTTSQKFLGGSTFRDNLMIPAPAEIYDGWSHKHSSLNCALGVVAQN
jgi:hypothetical protein